jgi:hypothetical protein
MLRTTSVARYDTTSAIPPTVHAALAEVDRAHVTWLPALPMPLDTCEFCPSGDPTEPAAAQLLHVDPRVGPRVRQVGARCIVTALHHLLGDGPVTVLTAPAAGQ